MDKPLITFPNRPKPSLVEAYNGYYGNIHEFFTIVVRFWQNRSPLYNDASLLCTAFPEHIVPTANNGFMNEFCIRNIEECYKFSNVWNFIEYYTRNWKYCEYYIGTESVYHNEMDCYIRNILKDVAFPNVKIIDPNIELKYRRGKWFHEKLLFSIIKSLYPDYTVLYHYRAQWLDHLELDIYIQELNIGIEYQGIQHYEPIEHWGGIDGLKQRQSNDKRKKKLCTNYGVELIYFDYTESITHTYVKNKMDKKVKKYLALH